MQSSQVFVRSPLQGPLRYPGGKSKALKHIIPLITEFDEFRELFVGGGSIFIEVKQRNPSKKYWINDLNKDLYYFWRESKTNLDALIREITKLKKETKTGKELYYSLLKSTSELSSLDMAIRFFVLNRITFSGLVGSGGYSEQAFNLRFTDSSLKRLSNLKTLLKNVKITNKDYHKILHQDGKNVFIFLDPPYLCSVNSRLYGKRGNLHTGFNHIKFADEMRKYRHRWLITYDDTAEIRELFKWARQYVWTQQYGMNNFVNGSADKGRELFISNYDIPTMEPNKIN